MKEKIIKIPDIPTSVFLIWLRSFKILVKRKRKQNFKGLFNKMEPLF